MKFVVQRVTEASVTVDEKIVGKIGKGFLVLVGVSDTDDKAMADKLVKKLVGLRIFEDSEGKTNLSLSDVGGELLMISQFTLYANCKKGNRPSFIEAGNPEIAEKIYSFIKYEGKVYKGREAVEILIKNQLEGVEKAAANGLVVKVNSVLIPTVNDEHIVEIAREVEKRGAALMNVLPLIPLGKMKDLERPDCMMMEKVREEVEEIIPVFRACTQCRADAYGIPGKKSEDHHLGMTPQSHY